MYQKVLNILVLVVITKMDIHIIIIGLEDEDLRHFGIVDEIYDVVNVIDIDGI